jgi:hypothetical protein
MALKDWKKTKHGINEWYSFKADNFLIINSREKYTVEVWTSPPKDDIVFSKKFKTKSKALKFAKSYMRKH